MNKEHLLPGLREASGSLAAVTGPETQPRTSQAIIPLMLQSNVLGLAVNTISSINFKPYNEEL